MTEITEILEHRTVNDTRQSCWIVRRTFTFGEHKIRATVKNDSYEFQSDFYVEVFSTATMTWNRVHTEATNEWYFLVDSLSTERLTDEKWQSIDLLIEHMVKVAADLLR